MWLLIKSNWFHWLYLPETLSFLWNWPLNKFSFWLGHFLSSVSWNVLSRLTYSLSSRKEMGLKAAVGGFFWEAVALCPSLIAHSLPSGFDPMSWLSVSGRPHELIPSASHLPDPRSFFTSWFPLTWLEKLYFLPFRSRSLSNCSSSKSMRLYFTWIPGGILVVPLAPSHSLVASDCSYA